jgi:serine/threonine protein kinase
MFVSPLPEPGAVLAGKYRIERLLGRGGMGAVYAAEHGALRQRVAVKFLLSEAAGNPEGLQRFINEARAAAQLDSEHITRVMDMGTLENGLPFMVLEYLEGSDLGQLLASHGPLPIADVVDYTLQACEALAQAHAAGIVHRDLKPSNLFLARRPDGSVRVKVLDFGISKVSDHSLTPKSLTSTKAMLGTPFYMSPEQMMRPKQVDARTDVWQLGITLFELLGGAPPFGGETLAELIFAVLNQPLPSLAQARPDVPPGLEQAIARCLERDATRRFSSVAELAAALAPFGTGAHSHLIDRMQRTLASRPAPMSSSPSGPQPAPGEWAARPVTPAPGTPHFTSLPRISGGVPPVSAGAPQAFGGGAPGSGMGTVLETGRSWGNASVPAPSPASSRRGVIVVGALFGLAALVGAGLFARSRWHPVSNTFASASASAAPPPPTAPSPLPSPPPAPPVAPVAAGSTSDTGAVVRLAPPADSVEASGAVDSGAAKGRNRWPRWTPPTPPTPTATPAPQTPTAKPATTPARPDDQLPDNSRQ